MFVFGNLILAVAGVADVVLSIYKWVVIIAALVSWVSPDPHNPIVRFLYRATEPVLHRVRRVLPDMGGIDLSPLLVILAIVFLEKFLVNSLFELVHRLKFGIGG